MILAKEAREGGRGRERRAKLGPQSFMGHGNSGDADGDEEEEDG